MSPMDLRLSGSNSKGFRPAGEEPDGPDRIEWVEYE